MNLTVKCPSCGGVVVLNPKTRQLQCTQCDSVISRGIGEENSAMIRNEDGELVDKRSYKAIQKIARIKRYITYDYHGIARKPCCGRLFLFQLLLYGYESI